MQSSDFGQWQSMTIAPRDGTRVLVMIRASEQGSAEVDVVRWGKPEAAGEACWIASDSERGCIISYAPSELTAWMPLPSALPRLRTPQADVSAATPKSTDIEVEGSGI